MKEVNSLVHSSSEKSIFQYWNMVFNKSNKWIFNSCHHKVSTFQRELKLFLTTVVNIFLNSDGIFPPERPHDSPKTAEILKNCFAVNEAVM